MLLLSRFLVHHIRLFYSLWNYYTNSLPELREILQTKMNVDFIAALLELFESNHKDGTGSYCKVYCARFDPESVKIFVTR